LCRHRELEPAPTHREPDRRVVSVLTHDLHPVECFHQRRTVHDQSIGITARNELFVVREVAFDQPRRDFGLRRAEHDIPFAEHDFDLTVAGQPLHFGQALGRDQVYVFHELADGDLIRRAAIAPQARQRAVDVGRSAMRAATATLQAALEERNGWTGKPSHMIAEMSAMLAQALDLPPGEIERVHTASLLHDLGKLAIPDDILDNPGELNDREWRVVSEHPKIGQVVLEQAGALRDAATIVLHHHEWFDGRGYPHGLAGQEIPVGARIVAIADAYEAMVAGRPYRSAIAHEAALAELRRHAGIQFDPELVRLFVTLFADGVPWTPEENVPLHIHGHGDAVPDLLAGDHRHHGTIHDAVHARRRGEVIHSSSRSRRISTNPPKAV